MSSPHPTLTAWERDTHDGFYTADLHDWKLKVVWTPNKAGVRGSFVWEATRDEHVETSHESYEEMEIAMAEAEHFAAADAKRRAYEISAAARG